MFVDDESQSHFGSLAQYWHLLSAPLYAKLMNIDEEKRESEFISIRISKCQRHVTAKTQQPHCTKTCATVSIEMFMNTVRRKVKIDTYAINRTPLYDRVIVGIRRARRRMISIAQSIEHDYNRSPSTRSLSGEALSRRLYYCVTPSERARWCAHDAFNMSCRARFLSALV